MISFNSSAAHVLDKVECGSIRSIPLFRFCSIDTAAAAANLLCVVSGGRRCGGCLGQLIRPYLWVAHTRVKMHTQFMDVWVSFLLCFCVRGDQMEFLKRS